jgi:hypothetical protein
MKITHAKVSSITTPPINPALVGGPDWNAAHLAGFPSTAFAGSASVPASVDLAEGTGGSSGITLTWVGAGLANGQIVVAIKVDSGAGAVTLAEAAGALFNGDPNYVLSNQWQFVWLQWNGTRFNVIGGN